jgi:hypothetical protein
MAKTRKAARRYARDTRETGSDLKFVGDAIDDAVAAIQRKARDLPNSTAAERRVLTSAMVALKLTAKVTKLHCGPRWFFLGR